jgi:hypothetical protein
MGHHIDQGRRLDRKTMRVSVLVSGFTVKQGVGRVRGGFEVCNRLGLIICQGLISAAPSGHEVTDHDIVVCPRFFNRLAVCRRRRTIS